MRPMMRGNQESSKREQQDSHQGEGNCGPLINSTLRKVSLAISKHRCSDLRHKPKVDASSFTLHPAVGD